MQLRVHPLDAEAVERRLAEGAPSERSITVVPDPEIGRGGCVAQTEVGSWDATVEERLRMVEASLVEA